MSFEVVAQSRIEQRRTTGWRLVVNAGLEMGCTGIALAMVGILSMLNERPIIVGLLTLGYATLGMLCVVAGLLVGTKRPFATRARNIAAGAVAGAMGRPSRPLTLNTARFVVGSQPASSASSVSPSWRRTWRPSSRPRARAVVSTTRSAYTSPLAGQRRPWT